MAGAKLLLYTHLGLMSESRTPFENGFENGFETGSDARGAFRIRGSWTATEIRMPHGSQPAWLLLRQHVAAGDPSATLRGAARLLSLHCGQKALYIAYKKRPYNNNYLKFAS